MLACKNKRNNDQTNDKRYVSTFTMTTTQQILSRCRIVDVDIQCCYLQTSWCRRSPRGRGRSCCLCSRGACRSPPATSTPPGTRRGRTSCAGSATREVELWPIWVFWADITRWTRQPWIGISTLFCGMAYEFIVGE